jgi:anti-anti-sigma factor
VASPEGSPWVVMTLSGELDMSRTDELDQMAAAAFEGDQVNAIFDLSDVAFMDSSALRWLLKVQERADHEGRCLRLVAPEEGSLIRLLSLTGLSDRFAVFPTRTLAEQASRMTDAVDDLLSTLSDAAAANPARQASYAGEVWEQATEAGYTEWTGLGHRLTNKGRARGSRIIHGSDKS